MFFSFSSVVLIGLLSDMFVFLILSMRRKNDILNIVFLIGVAILIVFSVFLVFPNITVWDEIDYLLTKKITDTSGNLSTAYRMSTVVNDLYTFITYPIIGVGNGNQGFLYNTTMNLPVVKENFIMSYEIIDAMNGKRGLLNGGAFTPAFISGYGIIGVLFLLKFLKRCKSRINNCTSEMGSFKYMYIIGGITFIITGIAGVGLNGNFAVMFVCSLPVMADSRLEYGPKHGLV